MAVTLLLSDEFVAAHFPDEADGRTVKRAQAGLQPNGFPDPHAAGVIQELLSLSEERSPQVHLVLPGRCVRTRRVAVDVEVGGTVSQHHISLARDEIRAVLADPKRARLYAQPSGFSIDDVPGIGDPVGQMARVLTVDAVASCVAIRDLNTFDELIADCGGQLADVVAGHLAAAAASVPSDGTGISLHIGYGETTAVQLRQHFAVAAAACPIGFRHLIQDVTSVTKEKPSMVAGQIRQLMTVTPRRAPSDAEFAMDARLGEMLEWARSILGDAPSGPIAVTGELAGVDRLNALWRTADLQSASRDTRGAVAPLVGAVRLVGGEVGCHEPARLGAPRFIRPAAQVAHWLRRHF